MMNLTVLPTTEFSLKIVINPPKNAAESQKLCKILIFVAIFEFKMYKK